MATVLASVTAVGAATLLTASPASAPEPVRLTQELSGNTGALAAAYYTQSGTSAQTLKWPGSWTMGGVSPGTPCSTLRLAAGETTDQVIVAYNGYRKCV